MKVYVSGPISGLAPEVYRKAFADRADWVRSRGWEPVNPCDLHHGRQGCCEGADHSWSCYMRTDLAAMLTCDAITTLDGWQGSHGARTEVFVAAAVALRFVDPAEDVAT